MLTLLAFHWLMVNAQAQSENFLAKNYTTPTKKLAVADFPTFSDDKTLDGFELAAQRQLKLFNKISLNGTIRMGGTKYPLGKAKQSLEIFLQLVSNFKICRSTGGSLPNCFAVLNGEIRQRYNVFVPDLKAGDPRHGEKESSFFTGYATQPITARSKPDSVYAHAVYALPQGDAAMKTRGEIDFHGGLAGRGLEIVYAPNLFDLYLLHIEGGGYITLQEPGGTQNFYLSFSGTNRRKFEWISKYMLAKGYIGNPSAGAQRKFLRQHPEKAEEIFSTCPSYVFFKVSSEPPDGAQGLPVTPGRSLATDDELYGFKGLITYVDSRRPVDLGHYDLEQEDASRIPMQQFSRFFIDQDTGGAIVGKGRADIYFGVDDYAQYAATYQQQTGNIYFLLLK